MLKVSIDGWHCVIKDDRSMFLTHSDFENWNKSCMYYKSREGGGSDKMAQIPHEQKTTANICLNVERGCISVFWTTLTKVGPPSPPGAAPGLHTSTRDTRTNSYFDWSSVNVTCQPHVR